MKSSASVLVTNLGFSESDFFDHCLHAALFNLELAFSRHGCSVPQFKLSAYTGNNFQFFCISMWTDGHRVLHLFTPHFEQHVYRYEASRIRHSRWVSDYRLRHLSSRISRMLWSLEKECLHAYRVIIALLLIIDLILVVLGSVYKDKELSKKCINEFACCGVLGPSDYGERVPSSCENYEQGCLGRLEDIFIKYSTVLFVFAIVVAIFQLAAIIVACYLRSSIRSYQAVNWTVIPKFTVK
ncbi:hypothetical protein TcWFU_002465 [Taenia crassiceps]|uniref:Tetraspanin n=1 Tax=Taenia crassiceps TaxID=6207 RepID=A0ABR4QJG4_9CEST